MNSNEKIDRDVLLEYVMGALTPEREKEVAAYLRQNPEDAAWVRDMFEAVSEVALDQEPVSVPASAESDLLKRIRKEGEAKGKVSSKLSEREKRGSRFWGQLGIGLALGVALFFVGQRFLFPPAPTLAERLEQTCNESGVICEVLTDADGNEIGTLAKRQDNTLLVVMNEAPPQGQVYQGWEIAESGITSAGVYAGQVLEITAPLTDGSTFGVTLEPPGGSPQPTSTPITTYLIQS
jgi:anti-sigma-K factor RskA